MSIINIIRKGIEIENLEAPFFFECGDEKIVMLAYFDIELGKYKVLDIKNGEAPVNEYEEVLDLVNDFENFKWLDIDLIIKNDIPSKS